MPPNIFVEKETQTIGTRDVILEKEKLKKYL